MGCKEITGFSSAGSWRAMATVLIHLLIASVAFGAARRFDDQPCQPRPELIELKDHGNPVKPYHILLYRCGGTCRGMSPQLRPCAVKTERSISVSATTEAGEEITVKSVNHTSCKCDCEIPKCKYGQGETIDAENCRCQLSSGPPAALGGREGEGNQNALPFIIGMVLVGFFAACVLVFDAIMCGKGFGVMHTIKTGCCGSRDRSPNCNSCSPKSPTPDVTSL